MKPLQLQLTSRDKTPNRSGYGMRFHHAAPQRRVPCQHGDLLAPQSADDIPPITPAAMESVQAAFALLANLVADRDMILFMGNNLDKLAEYQQKGREILLVAKGLAGILRVAETDKPPTAKGNICATCRCDRDLCWCTEDG